MHDKVYEDMRKTKPCMTCNEEKQVTELQTTNFVEKRKNLIKLKGQMIRTIIWPLFYYRHHYIKLKSPFFISVVFAWN
jgi:hypothetical protein